MNAKKSNKPQATLDDVLGLIQNLKSNHFSKELEHTRDPKLNEIIDSLNDFSKLFQDKANQLAELQQQQTETNTILEAMPNGLVVHDTNGSIEKFNPAALKLLGLTEDQLHGRTSFDPQWKSIKEDGSAFPGEEHPAMVALATNQPVLNTLMGLTLKDGTERWIKINAIPFESPTGRRVAVTFYDITEVKRMNLDMKHIFSHSMDLMCIASTDGTFKRISPSFSKILGFTESDLLTKPFMDYIHPDDLEATGNVVASLADGVPLVNFENRYRTLSGAFRRISWVCEPDPKTGLLYATGRDVTDLRNTEHRNQQILNALNQTAIVAFTNANGVITEVNDNFCKISGYSRDELIGKDHRILNSGRHPKSFFKEMWSTVKAGKNWTADIENRKKTGEHYFVRSVISPIRNPDGIIEQFIAVRFDVSEQEQTNRLLDEAQTIAKIGSWQLDLRTGSQTWSTEHYKIFEVDHTQNQDSLNKIYRERVHPDDLTGLDYVIDRASRYAEDFTFNQRLCFNEGKRIKYVQVMGKVTKDRNGKPAFISGTCQDMTEQRNLEESLTTERLKSIRNAKLASLGEMSAGIAHEINNPLAIIAGSVGLLSKFSGNPEKFAAKIESIKKSCDRIERIVTGLRKFSRSGEKTTIRMNDLNVIIREVLILTEAKSKRHTTPISVDCKSDLKIMCDEIEIEQVLVNLINNAIDAVKATPEKWIKVEAFEHDLSVVVRITDSGLGIPENIRNKLFEPFFTTKRVGEGTGLGLSITKGIMDEHKATITLLADLPNTCFELRFPQVDKMNSVA